MKPVAVSDEDSALHGKIDKAIVAAEVSKDLFERIDSKVNGLFGKMRTLQRWAIIVGALVVANLALTAAVILVLIAGGGR